MSMSVAVGSAAVVVLAVGLVVEDVPVVERGLHVVAVHDRPG